MASLESSWMCSVLFALASCGGDTAGGKNSPDAGGVDGSLGGAGSAGAAATGDAGDKGAVDSGGTGAGESGDAGRTGSGGSAGRVGTGDAGDTGDAGSAGGLGNSEPLPTKVDYTAAARPLTVTSELDSTAVQELDVPLGGATLSVTGANGTRYTLVIPDDALAMPTRIRMQAVSSLTGLPAGISGVHGVELEPSALQFLNAATLTIEPSAPVPSSRQAFFGYDAGGDDLHLVPSELGTAAQIKLLHFSGYGMAMLEREKSVTSVFVDVVPKGAEARLQSAMAVAVAQARQGAISEEEMSDLVETYFDQFENEVLERLREASGLSCGNAIAALRCEIGLMRQRELLGLSGGDTDAMIETVKAGRKLCFEDANQRCRVSGNLEELLVTHVGFERQAALLGFPADSDEGGKEETAIDKCGRYELEFDSTLTYEGVGANTTTGFGRLSVAARIPLRLAADWFQGLEGESEIAYTETFTRSTCEESGCGYYLVQLTRTDTARVRQGAPTFEPLQGPEIWSLGQPVEQTGKFNVEFDPGRPGESIDVMLKQPELGWINANQFSGMPPTDRNLWSGTYARVNADEILSDGWYSWDDGWTQSGTYPVMFERVTTQHLDEGLTAYEASTELQLVHKPIP
jgi:hypothetical protein